MYVNCGIYMVLYDICLVSEVQLFGMYLYWIVIPDGLEIISWTCINIKMRLADHNVIVFAK